MSDNLEPKENLEAAAAEDSQEQPEIITNDYGDTKDSTVVIEEEDRTVMLTDDETIIIEKPETIDITPANRPRKVYSGMWGTAEIGAVGVALLAVLGVISFYMFFVVPAQNKLEANRKDSEQIEKDLVSMQSKYGSMEDSETEAAKLITSVNDFEARFLRFPADGKSALYQRLNGLMRAYGLTNTSGPDYVPLEIAEQRPGQQTEEERGREKFVSLFPGVYVSVNVEGSYQNLRRFVSELENSQEFITIAAVELVPAEGEKKDTENQTDNPNNTGGGFPGQIVSAPDTPKPNRGKTRGEIVSLKIEMVSYFRRPTFQPMTAGFDEQ